MSVILRKTSPFDLEYVCAAESNAENKPYVSQQSREEHSAMLKNQDILHLIVEANTKPVGYVIIAGLTNPSRSIELKRIVITEKAQGYGRIAIRLCKELAFEMYNAHRLWLDVVDFNERAQHLYLSEGFVKEGVLRECDYFKGRFNSLVIMSILEREYRRN